MSETREHRLKRLHMRSIRRGSKEMDLILSRFAETRLRSLTDAELDQYEALLQEADQDLYTWVSGQVEPPAHFNQMIADIYANHMKTGAT